MNLKSVVKINFKYVTVRKKKCVTEDIKISYRALETIVEMGIDYVAYLRKKLESEDCKGMKRALYLYKIEEVEKISRNVAEAIGYCKSCNIKRNKKDDIETDVVALMAMTKEERDRM
jgi:hypothetical protein